MSSKYSSLIYVIVEKKKKKRQIKKAGKIEKGVGVDTKFYSTLILKCHFEVTIRSHYKSLLVSHFFVT